MGKYIIKESQLRQIVEESVRTYLNEGNVDELFDGARAYFSPFAKKVKEKGKEFYDATVEKGKSLYDDAVEKGKSLYDAGAKKFGEIKKGIEDLHDEGVKNRESYRVASQMQKTADKGQKMVEKTIQQLENIRTHYNVQKEDKYAISRAITALKRIMNNAFEAAKNKQAEVK